MRAWRPRRWCWTSIGSSIISARWRRISRIGPRISAPMPRPTSAPRSPGGRSPPAPWASVSPSSARRSRSCGAASPASSFTADKLERVLAERRGGGASSRGRRDRPPDFARRWRAKHARARRPSASTTARGSTMVPWHSRNRCSALAHPGGLRLRAMAHRRLRKKRCMKRIGEARVEAATGPLDIVSGGGTGTYDIDPEAGVHRSPGGLLHRHGCPINAVMRRDGTPGPFARRSVQSTVICAP